MISALELEFISKAIISMLLAGFIGWQREKIGNPAGIKTHIFVGVGATLFTLLSINFPGTSDPSRITANIVTGIGFLGAGAIFRHKDIVHGLTSAAGIWLISAVGIAVALEFYATAAIVTLLSFTILVLWQHRLKKLKERYKKMKKEAKMMREGNINKINQKAK